MTDLEMTKLCAEAMGIRVWKETKPGGFSRYRDEMKHSYNPIHNDAQAMALVKRFGLSISWPKGQVVTVMSLETRFAESKDYNRAIVECVAKMQQAKAGRAA